MGQNAGCCSCSNTKNQKEKDLGSISSFHQRRDSDLGQPEHKKKSAKQSSAKYSKASKSTSPIKSMSPVRKSSVNKSTSPIRKETRKPIAK